MNDENNLNENEVTDEKLLIEIEEIIDELMDLDGDEDSEWVI